MRTLNYGKLFRWRHRDAGAQRSATPARILGMPSEIQGTMDLRAQRVDLSVLWY